MAGKNKNPYARYAFIGLLVAIFACITAGLVGAAKGMVAIKMFTLDESVLSVVNIVFQVSIVLVVFGLAAYTIMVPNTVRRFFTGRQARYGSNSLIMTIAFLGIVFAVNYLVYQNPDLLGSPWDWTEDQSKTLAPETLQTLAALPKPVKATAFFSSSMSASSATELLDRYKSKSGDKFDYEFVDPNREPVRAKEAGITGDGKILLTMGESKETASYADESEITKALIRLINPNKRAVYFLQGHGEASLEFSGSGDTASYNTAKTTLESKNYTVSTLNLLTTKDIPADASVIVIAGPRKSVSKEEVARLKQYVDKGGSLFIMEDPIQVTDLGKSDDALADYLASDWGITLNTDIVIDFVNSQNPLMAVSARVGDHPITQNISQDYIVILPQARSLSVSGEKENVTQTPLLMTIDQSWGETDFTSGQSTQFDAGKDTPGPLNLAIAGENSTTKGRVVVFGNSIFAGDEGFEAYGNGNIFVNSVDWLAEQENLINLTVRERKDRIFTPPTTGWSIAIIVVAIFVLPGLVILTGISSWIARRRRG
jgi:ABC-type uncharacterized transport system involved in gliding motility auxiliary subunit